MGCESILSNAFCCLNQGLHRGDITSQLILSRTEDSSLDLNHILKTVEHTIDCHSITIGDLETGKFELVDIEDGIALTILADQTDRLGVGIASKTTCIFDQGSQTFVLAHLIKHGALDITSDTHKTFVWTNLNDIIILETDISR